LITSYGCIVLSLERSVEVDNLSESDGSNSECTQDSNRESSGEFIAKNSSILAGWNMEVLHASLLQPP